MTKSQVERSRADDLDVVADLAERVAEVAADPELSDEQLRNLAEVSDWCEWQSAALMRSQGCRVRPDVVSVAWELSMSSEGRWPLRTCITIAHRRVREKRGDRFRDRSYAIEASPRHSRATFDVAELCSDRDNPADVAALRMDTDTFLDRLNPTKRTVATMLAEGYSVAEVAEGVDLDAGHVRRLRSDLRKAWDAFSDPEENRARVPGC